MPSIDGYDIDLTGYRAAEGRWLYTVEVDVSVRHPDGRTVAGTVQLLPAVYDLELGTGDRPIQLLTRRPYTFRSAPLWWGVHETSDGIAALHPGVRDRIRQAIDADAVDRCNAAAGIT